jgi:hypothetical protein
LGEEGEGESGEQEEAAHGSGENALNEGGLAGKERATGQRSVQRSIFGGIL